MRIFARAAAPPVSSFWDPKGVLGGARPLTLGCSRGKRLLEISTVTAMELLFWSLRIAKPVGGASGDGLRQGLQEQPCH